MVGSEAITNVGPNDLLRFNRKWTIIESSTKRKERNMTNTIATIENTAKWSHEKFDEVAFAFHALVVRNMQVRGMNRATAVHFTAYTSGTDMELAEIFTEKGENLGPTA